MLFFIDEGASHHLICDEALFSSSVDLRPPRKINVANKGCIWATKVGVVRLKTSGPLGQILPLELQHMYFSKQASVNLYSVNAGSEQLNLSCVMNHQKILLMDTHSGKVLVEGTPHRGLHAILATVVYTPNSVTVAATGGAAYSAVQQPVSEDLWHRRFGHLGVANLRRVTHVVDGLDETKIGASGCAGLHRLSPRKTA